MREEARQFALIQKARALAWAEDERRLRRRFRLRAALRRNGDGPEAGLGGHAGARIEDVRAHERALPPLPVGDPRGRQRAASQGNHAGSVRSLDADGPVAAWRRAKGRQITARVDAARGHAHLAQPFDRSVNCHALSNPAEIERDCRWEEDAPFTSIDPDTAPAAARPNRRAQWRRDWMQLGKRAVVAERDELA
jgi:hypothetical protein